MTDSASAVTTQRWRWAVFKVDRGRPFRISKDFMTAQQAEEFVARQPSDWELEVRMVEKGE